MKISKIISATIAVAVFEILVGGITCGWLFNWVYSIEPINVWKPVENAFGPMYLIGILVLNLIFATIYASVSKRLPGDKKIKRGMFFGLFVWALGILPGMFATYSFMTVANAVIIYWTIHGLILQPLKGMLVAMIYENK